jgi:hypothetical protein
VAIAKNILQSLFFSGSTMLAPATALDADVEAAGAAESHLVRVDAGVEQLAGGEDQARGGLQRENADLFGALPGQQIPGTVEDERVADAMLAVAAMRLDDFDDDALF